MSEVSLTALTPLMPSQSAESESPKAAQESSKTQQEIEFNEGDTVACAATASN